MDLVTIVVLLGIAGGLIAYSIIPATSRSKETVKRRLEGRRGGGDDSTAIQEKAKAASTTQRVVKKAEPLLSRIIMPTSEDEISQLKMKLMQAGFRHPEAQKLFLGMKTACMALGVIAGGIGAASLGYDVAGISAACAFLGGLGFIAPGVWLGMATKSRQDRVRRGLPDILDLLVVSVESGLALDAAIKRVGEEMAIVHPDLSEEFRIATMEGQMGIPRMEALNNMATRIGLDELRSMISVIGQAERFGTSIAKALRNQGDAMRTKRRQEAEERAQKTAVKLMIPLVLFIFPAMGVVLAGPAALNLMKAFG